VSRPQREPAEPLADAVVLGVELDLPAIGAALGRSVRFGSVRFGSVPADVHLSVNADPATVARPALLHLRRDMPPCRVVLELTQRVLIDDRTNRVALGGGAWAARRAWTGTPRGGLSPGRWPSEPRSARRW
jgi:hypothetical protein